MTGLAMRRASSTARFCTIGTASSGSSTPRSPRATMMPSNASMIASRLSTACGFSILAMTGTLRPSSAMISCTRVMSVASRTNERAMRSAPRRRPQRRSASSFSDSAGTLTATPGQVDALVVGDRSGHDDLGRDDACRRSRERLTLTLPSSISRKSPGETSCGQALEGRAGELLRADDVFGRDLEDVADREVVRTGLELAEADLRALQVDEHGDRAPGVCGGLAHVLVDLLVHVVAAVAQVHPGDVDAGIDDRADVLVARRGWAEGRDDFCSSHWVPSVVVVGVVERLSD